MEIHSRRRQGATWNRTEGVCTALVVRTIWAQEGEVSLLYGNDTYPDRLAKNFDVLACSHDPEARSPLGDGHPIHVPGNLQMSVRRSEDGLPTQIVRQGNQFICYISCRTAEGVRDLTQALRESTGGRHQYLESPDPCIPAIILLKDEYDAKPLRAMSLD